MKKILFLFFLILISCDETSTKKEENQQKKELKKLVIKNFSVEEFSPEAQENIKNWWDFKILHQIFMGISPSEKPQNLWFKNEDSLLVFKRFYFRKAQNTNLHTERDWRLGEVSSDTIYRIVKFNQDESSQISWTQNLLKDVKYTYSFRVLPVSAKNFKVKVHRFKDKKDIREQVIFLDDVSKNKDLKDFKVDTLKGGWLKISTEITPPLVGEYRFSFEYDETEQGGAYACFYRHNLEVPLKYSKEIKQQSEKIINENLIKSSYTGIYFWLFQLEEELKQLWVKNSFPENLKTESIKSRFVLFETYVRELSDNVKNNPKITDEEIYTGIDKIQKSFSDIILQINFLQKDDFTQKMNDLEQKFQ